MNCQKFKKRRGKLIYSFTGCSVITITSQWFVQGMAVTLKLNLFTSTVINTGLQTIRNVMRQSQFPEWCWYEEYFDEYQTINLHLSFNTVDFPSGVTKSHFLRNTKIKYEQNGITIQTRYTECMFYLFESWCNYFKFFNFGNCLNLNWSDTYPEGEDKNSSLVLHQYTFIMHRLGVYSKS